MQRRLSLAGHIHEMIPAYMTKHFVICMLFVFLVDLYKLFVEIVDKTSIDILSVLDAADLSVILVITG